MEREKSWLIEYQLERYKLEKRQQLFIGVFLFAIIVVLVYLMVFEATSVDIQGALGIFITFISIYALGILLKAAQGSESLPFTYIDRVENQYYNGNVYRGDVQYNTTSTTSYGKQNLVEAAAEIQALLDQLAKENTPQTEQEERELETQAIEIIERNPSFKERVLAAVKAGGEAALKEAVPHSVLAIMTSLLVENGKESDRSNQ